MAFTIISVFLFGLLTVSTITASPVLVDDDLLPTNDTITITERDGNDLSAIKGFHGCKPKDKEKIQQAFRDAIMLVNGIGNPSDLNFLSKSIKDYFGDKADRMSSRDTIMGNFMRAQVAFQNWFSSHRYWEIHCDDPGDQYGASCSKPSHPTAYTVLFDDKKLHNKVDIINFCPRFFDFPSTADRITGIKLYPDTYHRDDVRSIISRGSVVLHEMFHIPRWRNKVEQYGISSPKFIDEKIRNKLGRAYGPDRAKLIARMEDADYGMQNVDNYVFFALSEFMYHKFGILAYNPPKGWRNDRPTKRDDVKDDVVVDDLPDDVKPVPEKKLNTEMEMYGTTEPLQCVSTSDDKPSTTQAYALEKITKFCKYVDSQVMTSTRSYLPGGYRAGMNNPWWGNDLWVSISWNPECPGKDLKVKKEDCERLLGRTLKDCNKNHNEQKKYGGTVFGVCGVYDLLVRDGNDATPPKGKVAALTSGLSQPGWDGNV